MLTPNALSQAMEAQGPEPDVPEVSVETLVGTALVFAFMAVMRLLPLRELGERQNRAARFFGAEAATFLDLEGKFAELLSSDSLGDSKGWFRKARRSCPAQRPLFLTRVGR